jgi:hypothetical protein
MKHLAMETKPDKLLEDLKTGLDDLFIHDDFQVAKVAKATELTINAIEASKRYLQENSSLNREEEIHLFKCIKPEIDGRLIFFLQLGSLVFHEPSGSQQAIVSYYRTQQQRFNQLLAENKEFYTYYRMDHTYLDHIYFTRNANQVHLYTGNHYWMMDARTNTPMSGPLAMIKAHELTTAFIDHRIWSLSQQFQTLPNAAGEAPIITWTGPKSALVELIVALQEHGVFNNTRVPLKRLSDHFSKIFNIKIGNIFKIHEDNRLRKKGRKPFLDALGNSYLRRLEYEDENI